MSTNNLEMRSSKRMGWKIKSKCVKKHRPSGFGNLGFAGERCRARSLSTLCGHLLVPRIMR